MINAPAPKPVAHDARRSPLTPAETARALFDLADRVGRLKPLNHDPEAFFVDRSEIEAELVRRL